MSINKAGLRALQAKSQLPHATEVAQQFGLSAETRYVRNARYYDINPDLLTDLMIALFEFQKSVKNYRTDVST